MGMGRDEEGCAGGDGEGCVGMGRWGGEEGWGGGAE